MRNGTDAKAPLSLKFILAKHEKKWHMIWRPAVNKEQTLPNVTMLGVHWTTAGSAIGCVNSMWIVFEIGDGIHRRGFDTAWMVELKRCP
jgi:hypothetical protein